MAYNRDKSKHGKYGYDSDEDDRVLFFLPSEDIDFEVLASDLKCYLGNGAQVEIGSHHRSGKPGYYIKSAVPVTTPMIQDLKADSARWRAECRQYNIRSYNDSHTHRSRETNGPSQRAPTAASYKQSRERERQDRPSQGPTRPQVISESRYERDEDPHRHQQIRSPSPQSNLPSRNPSYPSNPSRTEEAAYDSRPTPMVSKSSYDYSAPSKGFEYSSRHHREGPTNIPVGGMSVNYRQTETTVEVKESAYEHTTPGNQYSSPPRYTERQTKEVEKEIMLALKSRSQTVSPQNFDKLVNEQLERLYGSQQRQYQSKPLSQSQGGQKPPSGYIPSTRFPEPGGQKPAPGSVPFTQFPGLGGQNPPPGSIPFTQFPDSGSQNPPPGSVPFTQFPGSDKPPAATQPDYSGSYGFKATSGGPESNYPEDFDSLPEPSSQSYGPRSGKYKSRDGHDTAK